MTSIIDIANKIDARKAQITCAKLIARLGAEDNWSGDVLEFINIALAPVAPPAMPPFSDQDDDDLAFWQGVDWTPPPPALGRFNAVEFTQGTFDVFDIRTDTIVSTHDTLQQAEDAITGIVRTHAAVQTVIDWMTKLGIEVIYVDDENKRPCSARGYHRPDEPKSIDSFEGFDLDEETDELHHAIVCLPTVWKNSTPGHGWNPVVELADLRAWMEAN
ncbi:hypothetical protein SEA_BANTAM_144 [Gordonia phage Bantam]|uniref:Uncharacterized protein n=1 Tax=Gordonia phage Bantam TaxID=1887641 RepID=A0A1B3AYM5_9CAUD|nr:hypothetical protein BIZ77_gp035 [Gordonia phage Bantam]AOE43833.1 hypothetical protein SEA_BANTAM_144 [Gordonia phage Bantam]